MMHNPKCAAMHLDVWCVKADWLQNMVSMIQMGAVQADPERVKVSVDGEAYDVVDGVAVIGLEGSLMKRWSKYGGTSTLWARAAIRHAERNNTVKAILLHIDSPGGTCAGTAELADEVRRAKKPIHAHIDDLGASAAYWVASQADHISANRTGFVGSIGTYVSIYDSSGQAEAEGVKVHVLSTGPYKGAGVDGTPITEEQLAAWQDMVNKLNAHFENAVRGGRRMLKAQFNKVSDGRVFEAREAKTLGLVDRVESFENALLRVGRAGEGATA